MLSPSDRWRDVNEKVFESIVGGVGEVWVVDPETRTVRQFPADGPPQTYVATEVLTSAALLPGLQVDVGSLFP